MNTISKLHYITTSPALAEQACKAGIDWIQLRLKDVPYTAYYVVARKVQAVCRNYNATFIINDNVELALDIHADGVHIGKEDMQADKARELLGTDFIIGCTANTFDDVVQLSGMPIDYIGLGPYRFTNTKQNLSPVLGIEGYQKTFDGLKHRSIKTPPIIGIGGIAHMDVAELLSTGLHGIAVSSAISNSEDIETAAKVFKNIFSYKFQ